MFVYRDASNPTPRPSARHSGIDDASYWYDLLAEDPAPEREEARGPFEPLLPSAGTGRPSAAEQGQGLTDVAGEESREAPEQTRARKLEQLKDLYLTAEAIGEHNVDKHFDQLLAQQRELISEYFRQSAAAQSESAVAQSGGVQPGVTSPRDGQAAEAEPEYQQPEYQQPGHQKPGHQKPGHQKPGHQRPGASDGPVTPPEGVSVRVEPPRAW